MFSGCSINKYVLLNNHMFTAVWTKYVTKYVLIHFRT